MRGKGVLSWNPSAFGVGEISPWERYTGVPREGQMGAHHGTREGLFLL